MKVFAYIKGRNQLNKDFWIGLGRPTIVRSLACCTVFQEKGDKPASVPTALCPLCILNHLSTLCENKNSILIKLCSKQVLPTVH